MGNKKLITTVNVLGVDYKVFISTPEETPILQKCDGYIIPEVKHIYLDSKNKKHHQQHVLTHEIVHAFLYESGLDVETWANNEEIVDWISLQLYKMYPTVKKCISDFKKEAKKKDE